MNARIHSILTSNPLWPIETYIMRFLETHVCFCQRGSYASQRLSDISTTCPSLQHRSSTCSEGSPSTFTTVNATFGKWMRSSQQPQVRGMPHHFAGMPQNTSCRKGSHPVARWNSQEQLFSQRSCISLHASGTRLLLLRDSMFPAHRTPAGVLRQAT